MIAQQLSNDLQYRGGLAGARYSANVCCDPLASSVLTQQQQQQQQQQAIWALTYTCCARPCSTQHDAAPTGESPSRACARSLVTREL